MARPVRLLLLAALVPLVGAPLPHASAQSRGPILHEPIQPDAREDVALSVVLDGDLPAALETPSGIVRAPDPLRPPSPADPSYSANHGGDGPSDTFQPDRNTRRPDVLPYDDPFTPSTAPFKRLSAYDMVDASFALHVRVPRLVSVPTRASPASDGSEEPFFADLVVELRPGAHVRIPSVGPGARIVRAHAGVGAREIAFQITRDGAENWFIEGAQPGKARLVMELTAPRASFGGEFGNPRWSDLPVIPSVPSNVAASAAIVASKIGVSRQMAPRDVVRSLVAYFRSFADSDEPPSGKADIYLDLALSQKGVCRHRAFAFLVTALSLGLPTRMVVNEAHAWVEVNDGAFWRRIDLGGAGRTLGAPLTNGVAHDDPPDPFPWPSGATRGEDLAGRSRSEAPGSSTGPARGTSPAKPSGSSSAVDPAAPKGTAPASTFGPPGSTTTSLQPSASDPKDERPPSTISLAVGDSDTRRGGPLHVRGAVTADGEPCGNVIVEIVVREVARQGRETFVGSVATDAKGTFAGALVVPSTVHVGDYDVAARTAGDIRCGRGKGS